MKKTFIIMGATLTIFALVFVLHSQNALANPSTLLPTAMTAAATTTPSFMTPGTGTTTLAYDAYAAVNGNQNLAVDKAALEIQFTASSTLSVLQWNYEYADRMDGVDCTAAGTNCNWYSENLNLYSLATTSPSTIDASSYNIYSWKYASSTLGSSQPATALKILFVPTPTRFFRVRFYVPAGSGNVSVWAKFIPLRETK